MIVIIIKIKRFYLLYLIIFGTMVVEYNKRDLVATGAAVVIILILFLPSILVHFNNVKTDEDKDSRRDHFENNER